MATKEKTIAGPDVRMPVDKGADAEPKTPLRRADCEAHLQRTVTKAFREIVKGFVAEAKRGGCQHVKLATEIVRAPAKRPSRTRVKGPMALLINEYERELGLSKGIVPRAKQGS